MRCSYELNPYGFGWIIVLGMLACPLCIRAEISTGIASDPLAVAADQSVYRIHPVRDGTIIGIAALAAIMPIIYEPQIIKKQCPCDSGEVNRIDRPVIQYHSQIARTAGDVTVALALTIPPVLDGLDLGFTNKAFVEDAVVYAEVLSVNSALSNAFRYTVQRPRPDAYRISPNPSPPGGFTSFYSGHAASVFAGLSAASMTYNLRYGPHVWPWIVTATVGLGESATRIMSGRHFYTDTAAGLVAGASIGILIPYLHERNRHSTTRITPEVTADSVQLLFRRDF